MYKTINKLFKINNANNKSLEPFSQTIYIKQLQNKM